MLLMCFGRPDSSPSMPDSARASLQHGHRAPDVRLARLAARLELLGEAPVLVGLEDLERQVLELPLDLPDTQALGQRGVDLHRLAGDALLLLGRQRAERAHVVQPVGELDEHDADVLRHRQQHLADVLRLLLFVAARAELAELGDAIDETADLRPETLLDVGDGVIGVLGNVVQQSRHDCVLVEAELGEDPSHGQRVADVRLAADSCLGAMGLNGELPGGAHRVRVGAGMMDQQLVFELALKRVQRPPADWRSREIARLGAVARRGDRDARACRTDRLDRHGLVSVP